MNIEVHTIWIVAGLILLVGEMLTGGFFLIFIALGCFISAVTALLGGAIFLQALVCSMVAVLGMVTLRRPIQQRLLKRNMGFSLDVGKEITCEQAVAPQAQTRIHYQSTSWLATNAGTQQLQPGDRAVIIGIDGNTLLIRKMN
jgi:membrane protein implicated in regulation of membrane protease activity